jgi:uncharacterized protein YndB with AHSA1/START domain
MRRGTSPDPASFDGVLEIAATPGTVYAAFFSRESLRLWWGTVASITTPRPLGIYAVEWPRGTGTDALLGPLGGTFHGTVIDVRQGLEFFLADVCWMPPDGDPVGPMALHVTCDPTATGTRLRVTLSGCDDSPRWRRFYRMTGTQWTAALERLKALVERGTV